MWQPPIEFYYLCFERWAAFQQPTEKHETDFYNRDLWGQDRQGKPCQLHAEEDSAHGYLGLTPEGSDFFDGAPPANVAKVSIIASCRCSADRSWRSR